MKQTCFILEMKGACLSFKKRIGVLFQDCEAIISSKAMLCRCGFDILVKTANKEVKVEVNLSLYLFFMLN